MKKLIYIFCICCVTVFSNSQEIRFERRIPEVIRKSDLQQEEKEEPELSSITAIPFRKEPFWKRVLYRELDLSLPSNAPLYYPMIPFEGKQSLLVTIVEAVCKKELPLYEYIDGYELFEEENRLSEEIFLQRCNLKYEMDESRDGDFFFLVNKTDFHSVDVRTYYIKESWFVDRQRSVLEKEIIAICPLLSVKEGTEIIRIPLCWIKYSDISPLLKKKKVMTSDFNNTWQYSVHEYFQKGFYKGPIIKTENLMNKTLVQLYPDPDSLRIAQEEIEKQLDSFKKSLTWSPDSVRTNRKQIKQKKINVPEVPSRSVEIEQRTVPVRSVRRR